jgi:acetyltransferase-like isoleucine patch superfamily enzyme
MSLFQKYPYPCWIFAAKDELTHRISSLFSTALVRFFLRQHRCEVGMGFSCDGLPRIRMQKPGSISIGHGVSFNARTMSNLAGINQRMILHCIRDGRIEIGDGTGMSGVVLSARNLIRFGSGCKFGVNVRIYDHDFHSLDPEHRRNRITDVENTRSAPVILGCDVFVGANAMILKGVTLGDRCIIAAGSVVTRGDYPPDSLLAGNPATVRQSRVKSKE